MPKERPKERHSRLESKAANGEVKNEQRVTRSESKARGPRRNQPGGLRGNARKFEESASQSKVGSGQSRQAKPGSQKRAASSKPKAYGPKPCSHSGLQGGSRKPKEKPSEHQNRPRENKSNSGSHRQRLKSPQQKHSLQFRKFCLAVLVWLALGLGCVVVQLATFVSHPGLGRKKPLPVHGPTVLLFILPFPQLSLRCVLPPTRTKTIWRKSCLARVGVLNKNKCSHSHRTLPCDYG